ncbi:restriction endonuclease subunit S [Pantoea endophytica]|uniref:restriction endonuclease subunit S n=1 Tax=Pantoea endophytica TaxID=92488 RepID=UPI001AE4706A|nr:restriction endonuclease subunit S [Pantoea endophytica]
MTVEKLITDHIDIWSSALQTRSTAGRGSNGKIDLYGIKKLRELILELAVRGKLVPQDPNDEPAFELLKQIEKERNELVKRKVIRKPKALEKIAITSPPFDLPTGWEWCYLNDIGDWGAGATPSRSKSNYYNGDIPWFKSGELSTDFISDSEEKITQLALQECSLRDNKVGDVLIAMYGANIGKTSILNVRGTTNQAVCACTPYNGILNIYLLVLLKAYKRIFIGMGAGGAQPNISREKIIATVFALPPKAEQNRIICKVDKLMSLCDQLEQQSLTSLDAHQQLVKTLLGTLTDSTNAEELADNWARISQHFDTLFTTEPSIDALKQTILQLAVMGKLVPQDPSDEPASELLKRIAAEKAELVKQGKIKKQKPLPEISEDEKPFELPNGWEWCRLPDLGELARGKSKHRPRNDPALYVDGKYPLVQTGDVSRSNGNIKTFTALYNELGVEQSRFWPKGTLCITIAANIADSGILEFDACFPDSVVGYSPFISEIPVKYFDFLMRTMKSSLEKYAPSTAQKNINLDILSQLFVPCPPLNEFERVVRKVEALFSLLDQLKSRLQSAQQTQLHLADALTDAALN